MESKDTSGGRRAIVIGGSMGGLIAARALSDSYEQVTIVERDELPAEPSNRRGVPQGRHTHGLLGGGRAVLETLYPGFTHELVARGAVTADITGDVLWCNEGAYHQRFESGLTGVLLSRPLIEHHVRARTLALRNVSVVRGDVVGLDITPDRSRVAGVHLQRYGHDGTSETLAADLVVDASGRGSRALGWLETAGFARPAEEQIEVGLSYATRHYRRRPGDLGSAMGVVVAGTPANPRSGVVLAQEGDRWVVTLVGYKGDGAPPNEEGFVAFARSLPIAEIAMVVANCEPVGDFVVSRFPSNQRRRFEHLSAPPEGFLAFGDAICSFNPVYGQGMTVAAMEGLALQKCLREGNQRLARRFYAAAAKLIDAPWSIAVGNDLRMPGVVGPLSPMVRFVNWYMQRLHRAAWHDPQVAMAFQRVANLLAPPPSILAPAIARRVFTGQAARPSAPLPGPAPATA
jgi:2-polyprenyl-6-methoxyphenol hydroxylase-like FAD-dependent oxidoreductase